MDRLDNMSSMRLSDDSNRRDIPSFIEPRPPLVTNPFRRPKPKKAMNLMSAFEQSNETNCDFKRNETNLDFKRSESNDFKSNESDDTELVQVYLRLRSCRKPSPLYEVVSDKKLVTLTNTAGLGRKTQQNISKVYEFSEIFSAETTQKEIFEKVVQDNLNKLPDGHSYNLMTYGASGSGKTYTLMGTVASPGLVPRSLEYLFKIIDAAQQPLYKPTDYGGVDQLTSYEQEIELNVVKRFSQMSAALRNKYRRMSVTLNKNLTGSRFDLSSRKKHYVWVSFVEIYNESLYDLLQTTDRNTAASKLRIREDPNTGLVYAKGLTQAYVRSGEEAYDVMVAGKHNLQVAATGIHARSSRSHCIFTITLITETESGIRVSYVRLCDLAGCERAGRTQNTGARMAESRAINTSLHVLQRCLHALRNNRQDAVVPYRESKLTRLLGAGLSGGRGEAVSMVMTVNPDVSFMQESRHVLQLAAVVGDIHLNQTYLPVETTIATTFNSNSVEIDSNSIEIDSGSLEEENMILRATVERLHFELQQMESENRRLTRLAEEKNAFISECVEDAKAMTATYYEGKLKVAEKRHAREIEELKAKLECYKRTYDNETSSQQETHKDDTSVLNKTDDEDIDEDNRDTLPEDDDKCSPSEEDEKEEPTTSNRDNLVLLIESDSEDELNQSLEPRFKIRDENEKRISKHIFEHAPIEDEKESSDENDDITANSNKKSHDNSGSDSRNDMDGDSISTSKDFGLDSVGNDNQRVNNFNDEKNREATRNPVTKEQTKINETLDSSKESAIEKTPVDFEKNCVKAAENKESTEGYESFTDNDVNAEVANFAHRKGCSVGVVPAEIKNAETVFKKPEIRSSSAIKDKAKLGNLHLQNITRENKRKTDSLALFEQFEEDVNMQFKNTTEIKIRSNSILDFAKLKNNDANNFEQKADAACCKNNPDICKASDKRDITKENDDINKTKSIIEHLENINIPKKLKTFFDYPKNSPATQLEMVTLNLNSEQCTEFFREQEAKTKNDNMPKSNEHNPINEITFTKEVKNKSKTAKNSIDIFDDISASPPKIHKDKIQECSQIENVPTDLAKDISNISAEFNELLSNKSAHKESDPDVIFTENNKKVIPKHDGDEIDEEMNKKDPKPYKMMNESSIFVKSIISSPSHFDKRTKTKENIYIRSNTETSPYNEQEFTENMKSNLVSLDRQNSEFNDSIEQANRDCERTSDQEKQKSMDLDPSDHTKVLVTTAEVSEIEKRTENNVKKAFKFEIPKSCKTISIDSDMELKSSKFERLAEKDDRKARNKQNQEKNVDSSMIASHESDFKIPQMCNTISVDFELLAENIETRPSEFEQLAKNINTRASDFDELAKNIDAKENDAKVADIPIDISEKEINKQTEIEKYCQTVESPKKVIKTKEYDEIVNKHDTKAFELVSIVKTRATEFSKRVIAFEDKVKKHEAPKHLDSGSLEFEKLPRNIDSRPSEFEKLVQNIDSKPSEFEKLPQNIDTKPSEFEKLAQNIDTKPSEFEKLGQNIDSALSAFEKLAQNKDSRPSAFEKLAQNIDSRPSEFEKLAENIDTRPSEFEKLAQNIDSRPSEFEKLAVNIDTRPSEFEKPAKNVDSKSSNVDKLGDEKFENLAKQFNTSSSEFEKLAKKFDTSSSEFEKLAKNLETSPFVSKKLGKSIETRPSEYKNLAELGNKSDKTDKATQNDGAKGTKLRYNLRHKTDQENEEVTINVDNVFPDINFRKLVSKTGFQNEMIQNLCNKTDEPASTTKPKRNLRLRKQKTTEIDKVDTQKAKEADKMATQKLQDIVNLRHEFADVIMGGKVPETSVQKSLSPEIKSAEENVPVDACQSVPRSRRKLYTPRAELLEEPTNEEGVTGSGERIKIPRPSYQKTRTRRRLN